MKYQIDRFVIRMVKEPGGEYPRRTALCPEDSYEILKDYFEGMDREHFVILLLDNKNNVRGINTVSIGSLSASIVHPREVFKAAILGNAAGIILGHNHPSGSIEPSKEDISVTEKLTKAGKMMDIPVMDHIIVGDDDFYSFKKDGML